MNAEGLKVLLVDDMQLVLQRLQILLSGLKQVSKTEAAENVEKALSLLDHFKPHIMVLDINMPGMNGIEMLKQIKERKDQKPIVIMLTNHAFSFYREECMRLGADYFLDKSRDFLMIPAIIKAVQEKRMLQHLGG
jgi:DNA-binding NarL/FixJ family response regulator